MLSCARIALRAAFRQVVRQGQGSAELPRYPACAMATQQQTEWHWMKERGIEVNPCKSKLHPAVLSGAFEVEEGDQELAVQEAYTPNSACFGCGPAAQDGLKLRSFRAKVGLLANVNISHRFQAFPGIVNGGAISTLFDCHGNWTAAIVLMDKKRLPRPPLTLTATLQVQYLEPTPPDQDLVITSEVSKISEADENSGRKDSVEVAMALSQVQTDGSSKQYARAIGLFKKLGALRAL